MGINIRAKGQNGEREVALLLNGILMSVMTDLGYPRDQVVKAATAIQRNQNQSAVGGNDLSNTFGLSIEIKRQEQLSIPAWWRQCEAAAARNNEWPVLLYRQNNKPWKCMTWAYLHYAALEADQWCMKVQVEISYSDFQAFFRSWVRRRLQLGDPVIT
jgi:hypothetical protein